LKVIKCNIKNRKIGEKSELARTGPLRMRKSWLVGGGM